VIIAIYIAVGLVLTCGVLLVGREQLWPKEGWRALRHASGREDILFLLLIGPLSVALWPLYFAMLAYVAVEALLSRLRGPAWPEESVFTVRRKHLGAECSVAEIEAAEGVTDPLGAVADAPFGHLNAAWRRFLGQLPEGGRIARFSAESRTEYRSERLEGYVILLGDRIGEHWVVSRRVIAPAE
jgi:hypothetical protein